jgi:hypothetical protein
VIALVKALLVIARSFRRIAVSLEHIESMYRLELKLAGIHEVVVKPGAVDDVEILYGVRVTDPDNLADPDLSR